MLDDGTPEDRIDHGATQALVLELTGEHVPDWVRRLVVHNAEDGTLWAADGNGLFATGVTYFQLVQAVKEAGWMLYATADDPAPDQLADTLREIAQAAVEWRIGRLTDDRSDDDDDDDDPGELAYAGNPNHWLYDPIFAAVDFIRANTVPRGPDNGRSDDKIVRFRIDRATAALDAGLPDLAADHLKAALARIDGPTRHASLP